MSFRTVVITKRCKLDVRMNYMEIRQVDGKKRIFIDEISILIIENPAISLTGCLLSELIRKKIKVIFCDERHNPQAELISYYGSHDSSRKLRHQLRWSDEIKNEVWMRILSEKIRMQAIFLRDLEKNEASQLIFSYLNELTDTDEHNREGHAAKVYFNALFGLDFTRDNDCVINAALNYGYAILLSLMNREVVSAGYLTQLGLFHDNVFNPFNFSCDLMEPFRILIDRFVYEMKFQEFSTIEKHKMLEILKKEVVVENAKQIFTNAIHIYVQSIFRALSEGESSLIQFYRNEL